nr:response regulator [Prevotella sp.]
MRFLLLTALLLLSGLVHSQDFNYRQMKGIELPHSDEARCLYFDKMGRMWIGTNSGLKTYDGYSLQTYKSTARTPGVLPNNNVMSITEDHNHCIWAGTRNGLVRLSTITGRTKTYHLPNKDQRIIYFLYTSRNGTIWIGTDKGLSRYVPSKDNFFTYTEKNSRFVSSNGFKQRMHQVSVKSIIEDDKGNLFIGTWADGLMRLNKKSNTFYSYPKYNKQNSAYSLFIDSKKRLWVGTWGYGAICIDHPMSPNNLGVHMYNNSIETFNIIYRIIEDKVSNTIWATSREGTSVLNQKNMAKGFTNYSNFYGNSLRFNNDIVTDGRGNIWLETLNDGIKHINTSKSPFSLFNITTPGYTRPISAISSIYSSDGVNYLLSLKPYGLALYNKQTKTVLFNRQIPMFSTLDNDILETSFSSIVGRKNGEIWLANGSYGVVIVKKGEPLRNIKYSNTKFIKDDFVNYLFQSRSGIMFIGQRSGLSIVYPNNKGVILDMHEKSKDFSNCDVRGISEDHKGNIWVSTENEGIIRISGNFFIPKSLRYHHYSPSNKNYIVDDAINCFEDSRHILWAISNSGGLFRLDSEKNVFTSYNEEYSISGDRVFSINEDEYGNLWFTTDNALVRLSFRKDGSSMVTNFSKEDGLGDILFYPNSTFKLGKKLLFGNEAGFICFSPCRTYNKYHISNNLIISDLIIDGTPFNLLDSVSRQEISEISPYYTHKITIPSSVDKFSIVFSLLSFTNPEQSRYAYKLEGYDSDWHYVTADERKATFENIPSGTYHLCVKAADSYGVWQQLPYKVTVKVQPPFYASWWAFLIYFVVVIILFYLYLFLYKRHLKNKNAYQMAKVFTNITHELITPLTIITTAIDELKKKAPQFDNEYSLIQNNIQRLTNLLRQILEVRKSQSGELRLLVSRNNLSEFIVKECNNIRPMTVKKNIAFTVNCQNNIFAWYDSDKIDKILYNLLSNAVKYNKENGRVDVSLTQENKDAVIKISDNGIGISKQNMRHLYRRFFDGDYRKVNAMGTGIGLSLTKELVMLHHGQISCESKEGEGTIFTVRIPVNKLSYDAKEVDNNSQSKTIDKVTIENNIGEGIKSMSMSENKKEFTVLLVEDNVDLLQMMERMLSKTYNVRTAKNGRSALYIIGKESLDLVVSDIMMPVMDGIELTKTIKSNKDYAQLPIILLTAKVSDEDKNEAYKVGADDYLFKPFKIDDLALRINNILNNRKIVREKFISEVIPEEKEQHNSNPDELFIIKARKYVKDHIADSEIDRDSFAEYMCVSSSTLYNKLKVLTGQNIISFITSIRLKEAIRIVRKEPQIHINEIAYRTGFNSSKYFTKCFKKEYGMLLKDYLLSKNGEKKGDETKDEE